MDMLDDHSRAGAPAGDATDPHPDASPAGEPPTSAGDPPGTAAAVSEAVADEEDWRGGEAGAAAGAAGEPELGWSAARALGLQAEAEAQDAQRAALEAADVEAHAEAHADADAHVERGEREADAEFAASPPRLETELLREDSIIDEYGYERTRAEMSGRKLNKGIDSIRRQREW